MPTIVTHPDTHQRFSVGGRRRPRPHAPRLSLANYLRASLPEPPAVGDYSAKARAALSKVYLNDQLGCHSADTEVLTETGWTAWPNYDGVTPLATMNQISGNLEFQTPQAVQRKHYAGPMYFSDHRLVDFALTPGHRMFYKPYVIPYPYFAGGAGYGEYGFDTIGELVNSGKASRFAIPSATTGWIGADLKTIKIGEREWEGDDFIRLVAIVLSDGYVAHGETNRGRIGFCAFRESWTAKVRDLAARIGATEQPGRAGVFYFRDFALADWFRANGCYKALAKRVPALIKQLSMRQINIFLDFFGDQSSSELGQFYSSSKGIIDDLQELLLRVGCRSGVYGREARRSHFLDDGGKRKEIVANGPAYTLTKWQSKEHIGFQNMTRHKQIVDDWYDGEVFCATVQNSTLITRRNDSVLVSGNCCVAAGIAHLIGVWTANADPAPTLFADWQIKNAYHWLSDGQYPVRDSGCDEEFALNFVAAKGFEPQSYTPHRIVAWVGVDAANWREVKTALWLFEGLMSGVELPDAWINPPPAGDGFTFDVAGDPVPENGHCMTHFSYDADGLGCATWGMYGRLTEAALAKYMTPANGGALYAAISQEALIRASNKAPNGFDVTGLLDDARKIGFVHVGDA